MRQLSYLFLCLFLIGTIYSQQYNLNVTGNDISNYPEIKTNFLLQVGGSAKVTNISSKDIKISEIFKGVEIEKEVKELICQGYSVIFVVDNSTTMSLRLADDQDPGPGESSRLQTVQQFIKSFLTGFDFTNNEACLLTFSNSSNVIVPFTQNRNELDSAVDNMVLGGGTDFNAAFYYKDKLHPTDTTSSALWFCLKRDYQKPRNPETARFRPVVIFITDGYHNTSYGGLFDLNRVITRLKERNVYTFVVQIGPKLTDQDPDPIDAQQNLAYLDMIASVGDTTSKGRIWTAVQDQGSLSQIGSEINSQFTIMDQTTPCSVTWVSDCDGGNAVISFPKYTGATASNTFTIPDSLKQYLEFDTTVLSKFNPYVYQKKGATYKQNITVRARQNDVKLFANKGYNNPIFKNDIRIFDSNSGYKFKFKVSNDTNATSVIFMKDVMYTIALEYTALDDLYSKADIELLSSACSGSFTVSAEMAPSIDTLDFGNATLEQSKDSLFYVLCNRTGRKITIKNIALSGIDQADYGIMNQPKLPFTLDTMQCLSLKLKFSPSGKAGLREAVLELTTDYIRPDWAYNTGILKGIIRGTGIVTQDYKDILEQKNAISISPNPASGVTNIDYYIFESGRTSLRITDLLGNNLSELINEKNPAPGWHRIAFDSKILNAGVYLVIMESQGKVDSRKFVISSRN